MSTKNIARSAVEGGRANYNKYQRRHSNTQERARTKTWLANIHKDIELAEDSDPEPRAHIHKEFTDKLNPCYSWLASNAGKPWAHVRSKLAKTFDTRKLSAWHIVNQHMLTDVMGSGAPMPFFATYHSTRFYVDDDGKLQDRGCEFLRYVYQHVPPGPTVEELEKWLNGRRLTWIVGTGIDVEYYWTRPCGATWVACPKPANAKYGSNYGCRHPDAEHRIVETTPATIRFDYTVGHLRSFKDSPHWHQYTRQHLVPYYRLDRRLTKDEMAWLDTVSPYLVCQYRINATSVVSVVP